MSYNIPGIINPQTFTPTLSFGGGSTGIIYSTQYGYSTSIIHQNGIIETKVWGYIGLSNKGSSTGSAVIGGFLIPAGTNGTFYRLSCILAATSAIAGSIPTLIMVPGQSSGALAYSVMNGSGGAITNSEINNNSVIQFWGSYLDN